MYGDKRYQVQSCVSPFKNPFSLLNVFLWKYEYWLIWFDILSTSESKRNQIQYEMFYVTFYISEPLTTKQSEIVSSSWRFKFGVGWGGDELGCLIDDA